MTTDNIDTPESVRAVLAQLGGPNAEFYSGEAADMLRSYADLLERSAGVWVSVKELPDDKPAICYRPRADVPVYMQYRLHGQWQEEDGSPTIPATHFLDVRLPTGGE